MKIHPKSSLEQNVNSINVEFQSKSPDGPFNDHKGHNNKSSIHVTSDKIKNKNVNTNHQNNNDITLPNVIKPLRDAIHAKRMHPESTRQKLSLDAKNVTKAS